MDRAVNREEQLEVPVVVEEAAAAPAEFPFTTLPPVVSFETVKVAPPSELYVAPGDGLMFLVANRAPGAYVWIHARLLRTDGQVIPMEWEVRPDASGIWYTGWAGLAEGFLLSVHAEAAGALVQRGQCYVGVRLTTAGGGGTRFQRVLVQGYATTLRTLSWPPGIQESPVEGRGSIRTIIGTNPAAGVEISETVPAWVRWRILGFKAFLITSAAVANRRVFLAADDGASAFMTIAAAADQTASQNISYNAGEGFPLVNVAGFCQTLPLAGGMILRAGYRLLTWTANLQAADNWSAPIMLVEEWIEG